MQHKSNIENFNIIFFNYIRRDKNVCVCVCSVQKLKDILLITNVLAIKN